MRITEAESRELVAYVFAKHGLDLFTQSKYDLAAVYAIGHRDGLLDREWGLRKVAAVLKVVAVSEP